MEPAGKAGSRVGPRQAPSPSAPRGAKVTPRHPASAVSIQGSSRLHLALNINVSACKRWGAARVRAREPLQHPSQASVGVPLPPGPARVCAEPPPSLPAPGSVPRAREAPCRAPAAMHHSCACSLGFRCCTRTRRCTHASPRDSDIRFCCSRAPCALFCVRVGLCGSAGTPVPPRCARAARHGGRKGWGWLRRDCEGSWCRHQFGLSGPAVMATHIPFASGAKRRQLLPRDPRSPWRRGEHRRREGRGAPAAPVRAAMSSQRPKNRAVTEGAPSPGKTAPACPRSAAPTTPLAKGPIPLHPAPG